MATEHLTLQARRLLALAFGGVVLAALALATLTPVPDNRAALVLRFGQPVRVIEDAAGLVWRWPLAEQVVLLDSRLLTVTADNTRVVTRDGQALAIDGYATWRVTDPVRFYLALGSTERAAGPMRAILSTVLQHELGRVNLAEVQAQGSNKRGLDLRAAFARELAGYGASVTDLRLSRVALPDGAPLDAAYARMTSSAEADAAGVAAEGHRNAQWIRADAQARAEQIYAASFGKDPEFHDFYRAMQSYDATFAQKGSKTTIVLSPDNAYLQQFRGH